MKICLTDPVTLKRELLDLCYVAELGEATDTEPGVKQFIYQIETTGGSEGDLYAYCDDLISLLMCGSYPVKIKGILIWG